MSTNLILIDSNLKDTDVLLSALNAQTTGILYNYDTSRNTILQQIDATFSVKAIERVAICCHEGVNQFLENGNFFDLDSSTNEVLKNPNTQFILDLLKTYNVSNIDFIACNSLKYDSWKKFYDLIENETGGVTVGASEDETGNLKYGGNWVMENTNEVIDSIYFNEGLRYYKYIFDWISENLTYTNDTVTSRSTNATSYTVQKYNTTDNVFVTKIGDSLMISYNTNYSFSMPNSITTIGVNAFRNSTLVGTIILPHSVTTISNGAFISCRSHIIYLPFNLNTIGTDAFKNYAVFSGLSASTVYKWFNFDLKYKNFTMGGSDQNTIVQDGISSDLNWTPSGTLSCSLSGTQNIDNTYNITLTFNYNVFSYDTDILSGLEARDIDDNIIGTFSNATQGSSYDYAYNQGVWNVKYNPGTSYFNVDIVFKKTKNLVIFSSSSYNIVQISPPTLDTFTITPSNITVENHGKINMTFSDDKITQTDISNSLYVNPSNAGIIDNITGLGTDWTADFTPNYGLDLTDCSLNFIYSTYGINEYSNTFNIETHIQQIKSVILAPENIITDLSSNLEVILRVPSGTTEPTITIDPSYIANLDGNMTSSDGGLTWNGSINRTLGMNLLGNTLTVSSGDISSNIAFDAYDEQYLIYNAFNNTEISDISVNNMRLSGNGEYALVYDQPQQKTFIYSYSSNDNNWVSNHNIHHTSMLSHHSMQLIDISESSRFIIGGENIFQSNAYLYDYNTTDGETLIKTFGDPNVHHRGIYTHASISDNGNVIALGNTHDNLPHNQTYHFYSGTIRVFYNNGSSWNQIGSTLYGAQNDRLGTNIQISGDGNAIRTLVGNYYKTYYYISGNWQNKTNPQIINRFSVMNYDGTIYAVNNKLPSNNFLVEIYVYNSISDSSVKTGDFKFSEHTYFSEYLNLSMSSNGDIVAVGYTSYNNNRGITLLYKNNGTSWEKIYSLEGTIDNEKYGSDVILSNDGKTLMTKNNNKECKIIKLEQTIGRFLSSQIALDPSNIEYPNTTSNFQINFTTNDKTFDDISGNVSLTSGVSNIDTSSLALTNYGFRLEGNIVANPYSEDDTNTVSYFETVDISGESANFTVNTVPEFELLGCTLTPENLVDTDVSATLRIEFNTPITGSSPNFNFTLDPSYIATLGPMSDVSSGFVWEGVITRTQNMNKLENKLDFDFSYNGVEVTANLVYDVVENSSYLDSGNLIHKATNISTISNIDYPNTSSNFAINFTTNDVLITDIESKLSIDPSNVANITNTTLTNYGFILEGQLDVSGEHNVSGVKFFYEDFSSNAFDIYSIQDLSIDGFVFDNSAVTYENYLSNNITLRLNRNDLTNVDISNSLQISPSSCGQIVDVSGSGVTREISFEPAFYILESDCSLTFHFTNAQLDASMTIPFSVDTLQQIEDISMNPRSILEPNSVSTLGVKFRLPVESSGIAPDITITPSYIANVASNPVISGDTWTGTIQKSQNKNLLYNTIDFSYNGFDTSLNFNVAQNPELIMGPREIGDFVECNGIKITSVSLTEEFTISEVQITDYDTNSLILDTSCSFLKSAGTNNGDNIMDQNSSTVSIIPSSTNEEEKYFNITFFGTINSRKIKDITIYASHSVKIELLTQTGGVYETIANLGQVNVDVSGTINIANASTQSTITRAVTDITLNPSNIVYPDVSSNFEMLFSTNTVSLSDISNNNYLTIDPSNAANLTNLRLTENDFKLVGKIEAIEKIFEEVCKLKYDETIDISGEKQLAIKDLFISSSSIVPKTDGVYAINFEHNVGILELVFTLDKPDLVLSDFVLDNSATITNLTKDGLKWNADITFPRTDSDVLVNYNIVVNYKTGDTYPINKTYNTYVPVFGGNIPVLDIYQEVPEPDGDNLDISLNDTTILTSGSSTDQREKREVFIERLLDTYKDNLKTTTDKLVMKTEELLGTNSGITKEKIKIIDNFDTNGDKLSDISFNTQSLSGDEALYVPLDVGYSIILDTYSSKLKIEKNNDTSFNVYENYIDSNPIITKVMTYDETGIYDFFQYKIGSVEGENLPVITNITLNPSNIISDLSSNLQVEFSQPAIEPIIKIDPSYIAYLDGNMTSVDGYIWSGTINSTLEMNRLDNILTVSGKHHTSNISFNVLEDNRLYLPPTWSQMGLDLNGENSKDQFGNSVSLSSDGTIVAIAAKYDNTNGDKSGQVKVYKYNGVSWIQLGKDINGNAHDECSWSVSLSSDGTILAIGIRYNDYVASDAGKVSVYIFSDSNWEKMGSDIYGEGQNSYFGESVSLSSDGQTLIIGAPDSMGKIGYVEIYKYQSDWVQLGNTFRGVNSWDSCGKSVSISSNGNIVAFSHWGYNIDTNYKGKVEVYQYDENVDGSWNKLGLDIIGENGDFLGISVSLSSNGEILAISSDEHLNYKGYVKVYKWDIGHNTWSQIGSNINGENNNDRSGKSVSLSSDGNILAIGAPGAYNERSSTNSHGYVRVYQWSGHSWEKIGNNIIGKNIKDRSGESVSLSSNGKIIAIGAPRTINPTVDTTQGHVRIYSYYESIKRELTSTTLTPSDIIYPDSSSNFELLFTTNEKTLNDISGNLQLEPSGIGNLTNLQLAHSGFKLVGNIEAPDLKKNKDTKLKYFETVDISGESDIFDIYTYPPFQLVNFGLTPENIVGPNDVSSNLQIEFNVPISTETSLNNSITIDPSYIVNLDTMTTSDGYTWSGAVSRSQYMNKLENKLDFSYTYNNLGLNDEDLTVSGEIVFDVLENKNVLKWEKKTDTSLNETFNETVEISPNCQILAQISGSDAKIYHLQSNSSWSLESEISGNHLSLCDNRIAIATDVSLQFYEYDSNWGQSGSISQSNVSNLDISIDGNRVAYVYDASSIGILEYFESSWSPMIMAVPITGNSVKFSPNGLLLGVGTLDSENQNFSNVVLYEYSEGSSSWNLKT